MTYEEAENLMENNSDNYMKDEKNLVKGLQLLEKYGKLETASAHDVIFVAEFNENMTEEDILQLHRWGFHLEEDSWAYFT